MVMDNFNTLDDLLEFLENHEYGKVWKKRIHELIDIRERLSNNKTKRKVATHTIHEIDDYLYRDLFSLLRDFEDFWNKVEPLLKPYNEQAKKELMK